jgi:endonuclease/exonuclease/phosphatase family metal-dependent hydrolase
MAKTKQSATKKGQKKPKVVTGSGKKKQTRPFFWQGRSRIFLIAIFALSFGAIGFYLLKNSLADTGTTITVASWNSKIDNKNNIADEVKTILKKANVVGLQEVHTAKQRNNIQKLIESNKYAVSPKAHTNNDSKAGVESYAIVWREKEFFRVKEGVTGQVSPDLDGLRPRYITWVKLQQRATGKQFYVVNTHLVRDVEINGSLNTSKSFQDNVAAYKGHMSKLVALVKNLQKDKVPVFVTGDFAVDYRKDTGKVSTFPKAALGAIGVKSNWQLTNLNGIASKAKTYGGSNRLIDYVFSWGVTPQSTAIGGSKHGSDHYPVYFTADLTVTSSVDTR